jgi:hypothetical protein
MEPQKRRREPIACFGGPRFARPKQRPCDSICTKHFAARSSSGGRPPGIADPVNFPNIDTSARELLGASCQRRFFVVLVVLPLTNRG